ncbi:MAG: hypothetical protein H0T94_05085 [Acidimicrobiia bacterium]|nr:hypothetical protein [Acidimicrobiia bacterium]
MQLAGSPSGTRRLIPLIVGLGCALAIIAVVNPRLLLTATTPTGGDMAAHVAVPAFLRDVLLPQGRILGWSQDWFAGFPVFYFYFPLPSLVVVLLDLVLPYGVAFKLVTIAGLLATPPATYYLARSLKFGRTVSTVAAAGGAAFVFMESFTIYGANLLSTMAGEFSFSWSFALSLFYLAFLIRSIRDDRRFVPIAGLFLAAAVLSHIITIIAFMVASLAVLFWKGGWKQALKVWAIGFGIAAFWMVPLFARLGFSSDLAWTPLRTWEDLFPLEMWLLLPAAIGGGIWAMRRSNRSAPVVALTLLPLIYYPLPFALPELLPGIFNARWKLWNGRLLPFWYFGATFFAAIGIGAFGMWLAKRFPDKVSGLLPRILFLAAGTVAVALLGREENVPDPAVWAVGIIVAGALLLSMLWLRPVDTRSFMALSAAGILAFGSLAGITIMNGWARWNFAGYEGKAKWPEYQALMQTADTLAPGRIHWEYDKTMNDYGSPMALMLFPYWTQEKLGSMEGLFFESSLSTPFHFLNQAEMSKDPSSPIPGLEYHRFDFDRGVPHMQLFGIDYYVSYTPESTALADARPELTEIADSPPFTFYEVADSDLVEAATFVPAVYDGPHNSLPARLGGVFGIGPSDDRQTFEEFSLEWYGRMDLLDHWIATEGPADWPRVGSVDEVGSAQALRIVDAQITNVEMTDDRISFQTDAIGVPHLVKVSYFPNWQATGADGPYHAGPSFMIVVPTDSDVTLSFGNTGVENVGWILTIAGMATAAWLLVRGGVAEARRRQPATPAAGGSSP